MGSAVVLAAERYVGAYILENLSASGALLVGDTKLSAGERVRLLLQIHGRARRFALTAVVVRQSSRGAQSVFAVRFLDIPAAAQDALQTAVLRDLGGGGHDVVVVGCAPTSDVASLERSVQELGFETVMAPGALDVISWLHAPEASVVAVIADANLDAVDGASLLEFIEVDYPAIRRVLARSSSDARDAVPGAAHVVLERPWTPDTVARALAGLQPIAAQ